MFPRVRHAMVNDYIVGNRSGLKNPLVSKLAATDGWFHRDYDHPFTVPSKRPFLIRNGVSFRISIGGFDE